MSNVININVRAVKKATEAYRRMISQMDKLELLEEMVRFQETRRHSAILSVEMKLKGQYLFSALEKHAETPELRILSRAYLRHLESELKAASGQESATNG